MERLAHTTKGVSGSLGATKLQEQAGLLEQAVHDRDDALVQQALPPFSDSLSELLEAITSYLETLDERNASHSQGKKNNLSDVKPILNQLRDLVADDDGEAEDYFLEHRDSLAGVASVSQFSKLGGSLQDFEFEAALPLLDSIISAITSKSEEVSLS